MADLLLVPLRLPSPKHAIVYVAYADENKPSLLRWYASLDVCFPHLLLHCVSKGVIETRQFPVHSVSESCFHTFNRQYKLLVPEGLGFHPEMEAMPNALSHRYVAQSLRYSPELASKGVE